MSRTGMNIYKRKDGRWEGRFIKGYCQDGKAKYGYVYARSYAEAKDKLSVLRSNAYNICEGGDMTFSNLAGQWLSFTKIKVKESTYARYINLLEGHILYCIGGYKLKKLTSMELERFITEKLESGRLDGKGGLSAKTVKDILSVVHSILRFGETEKYIVKDSINVQYPKYIPMEMRVFSKEEQLRFESVISKEQDVLKLGMLVCLYTGIRIGEVCALRWKDISLHHKSITIRRTIQRIKNLDTFTGDKTKIIIDKPKTKCSLREIPIPDFLIADLERFRVHKENAYFLTGDEERFIEPRTYQNYFKAYVRESKIRDANFHCLRHTFSTRCIEKGFDVKSLSEILGHSNVNITLCRYVHSSFEQKRKNMNKLYRDLI